MKDDVTIKIRVSRKLFEQLTRMCVYSGVITTDKAQQLDEVTELDATEIVEKSHRQTYIQIIKELIRK